jgi:acetyl esterase/lipase
MKRIFTITFTLVALLMGFMTQAQNRYLQEIYTDADIEVTSNVIYGTNINFLTSTLNNPANIGRDLTEIMTNILTGQSIPTKFYNPGDNTTDVKVTDLKMDIYKPNSTVDNTTDRPVIVYLHTGNFLPPPINGSPNGTKNDSLAIHMCRSWAKRGYVAVSVEYRLGWNPLAATVQERRGQLLNAVYRAIHDTKKAVRFLKDDATNYGIDADKI